jgi:hypothetical protein
MRYCSPVPVSSKRLNLILSQAIRHQDLISESSNRAFSKASSLADACRHVDAWCQLERYSKRPVDGHIPWLLLASNHLPDLCLCPSSFKAFGGALVSHLGNSIFSPVDPVPAFSLSLEVFGHAIAACIFLRDEGFLLLDQSPRCGYFL